MKLVVLTLQLANIPEEFLAAKIHLERSFFNDDKRTSLFNHSVNDP
jgi:hypothetical protein